jgi:hypothetical protein
MRTKCQALPSTSIDAKVEQQREFVGWWGEKVTPNRTRKSVPAVPGEQKLTEPLAQELTGITNQQVSKWRKRLTREDEYRAAIPLGTVHCPFLSTRPRRIAVARFYGPRW